MVCCAKPYWSFVTCQNWIPIDYCARREALSERALARLSELSRDCLCRIKADKTNVELSSLVRLSSFLSRNLLVLSIPTDTDSECATIAVALKVQRDGFESWKVHFMDFVDAFRRSADPRLVLLPLPRNFDLRLTALLASLSLIHI